MIGRAQLLSAGLSPSQARAELRAGRWRAVLPGVYSIRTGAPGAEARVWAAWLYAGDGAAVSGRAALWLAEGRLSKPLQGPVEVDVPRPRRVAGQDGVAIRRRDHRPGDLHDSPPPRHVRPAVALVDLTVGSGSAADVAGTTLAVVQRRLARPASIAQALEQRGRHPWRGLLSDLVADVAEGVQSPLERRYVHDVQRAHGLPEGRYNHRDRDARGVACFRDVVYEPWRVIVELDGREFHAPERAFRDRGRDNRAALTGNLTLRYGWYEVASEMCAVAGQVGDALQLRGWTDAVQFCSAACTLIPGR